MTIQLIFAKATLKKQEILGEVVAGLYRLKVVNVT